MALFSDVLDEPGYADTEPLDGYWAARSREYIACEIEERVRAHFERLEQGGFLRLYWETHAGFYGLDDTGAHTSSQIIAFGDDGEKLGARSNQMRSLMKFVYLSATSAKPAIKPRAINSKPESLAQIPTARRLLEYYDRVKKVQKALNGCALRAIMYGKAYLWQSWDPFAGPLGPDGKPLGDLLVKACSPMDVACDLDVDDGVHDWFAVRVRRNRYDLVAMYADETQLSPEGQQDPALVGAASELKDKILDAPRDILEERLAASLKFWHPKEGNERDRNDSVFEYHFMHRRTPAMPEGRYVIVLPGDTVLFDGPLPYEQLPIDVMCPEEFLEMGDVGYSSAWDLIGMQQAYDSVLSVCLTNHEAFGHNDVLLPEGVEIGYEEIREGLNVLRYPMGEANKPSILEKFSIKDEAFKLKDWLKGDMELVLAVNSVARGEPEASLESGAALALVQAQAIQAQSPFVQAFNNLIGESGTNRIKILREHLDPARTIAIAGDDDPDSIVAFSSGDIAYIDRIEVEGVNPLFQTMAGRQNAADKLLERGLILSPAAYLHFIETGRLETVTDDARRKDLFGRRVREILMQGPAVSERPDVNGLVVPFVPECRYIITDNPKICVDAAAGVLDSFENRKREEVLNACLAYQQDVLSSWRAADPAFLTLMGYPLPPMPGTMPTDQPGQGAAATPDKPPGAPGAEPAKKPVDQQAPPEGSTMPSLPKPAENPL